MPGKSYKNLPDAKDLAFPSPGFFFARHRSLLTRSEKLSSWEGKKYNWTHFSYLTNETFQHFPTYFEINPANPILIWIVLKLCFFNRCYIQSGIILMICWRDRKGRWNARFGPFFSTLLFLMNYFFQPPNMENKLIFLAKKFILFKLTFFRLNRWSCE